MANDNKGKAPGETQAPTGLKTYTVKGPGNIFVGGSFYTPGKTVELSDEDAAGFGASVYLGRPKPIDKIEKRTAGNYVVAAERNVWSGGALMGPGAVLQLSEAEARTLGDAIEPAE